MGVFTKKQPNEAYYIGFDFSAGDIGEDSISSAVVSAEDEAGNDATSVITDSAQQTEESGIVYVWVNGGISGETYKITCRITTSTDSQYELDGFISVVEK